MKKTVALCMAICAIGLLATCKSNSSLTSQLKKMPTKAMLLTEVSERGITLNDMESLYPNGMTILGDSIPQEYGQSWIEFVTGIAGEMRSAEMSWNETYRLWGRAYFAPDGTVEHYFYRWTGDLVPSEEWQAQFHKVLENYLGKCRFKYPMDRRFAQCGGVLLKP